jgi:hypothetical protein
VISLRLKSSRTSRGFLPSAARHPNAIEVFGELAQLGERLVCNQEVTGSSPVFSTIRLGGGAASLRAGLAPPSRMP